MTVAQNMGFAVKLAGMDKAEIATRVGNAAGILNIEALLDRYPRQLSGGQRQRVAMGRAIVRNPQVFLFEDPHAILAAIIAAVDATMDTMRGQEARIGRARIFGEKSKGLDDPGMLAFRHMLRGLHEHERD